MPAYISEFSYLGTSSGEFIEIAVPAGTDVSSYSVIFYQFNGTIYNGFSLGTSVTTMNGHDIYVINNSTLGFSTGDPMGMFYADDAIALFDGSAVIQFISWAGNTVTAVQDPANGLTSTEVGFTATEGNSLQSDDGGLTYYEQTSVNQGSIPACYATGMLLLTPQGWRAVEALQEGDYLLDASGEAHPILWVWRGTQALDGTGHPVLISRGALGPNRPFANLIVSPQHRIVLDGSTFAPAKALTALKGIREMRGKREITWHHFACAAHIVVLANGVESESLLLGPQVLKLLRKADLQRLYSLFESVDKGGTLNGPPALPCLTVAAARRRLAAFEKPAQYTANDAAPCGPFELTHSLLGESFAKTVAF